MQKKITVLLSFTAGNWSNYLANKCKVHLRTGSDIGMIMVVMKEKQRHQAAGTGSAKRPGVIRQLSMLSSRGSSVTRDDSKCDR